MAGRTSLGSRTTPLVLDLALGLLLVGLVAFVLLLRSRR